MSTTLTSIFGNEIKVHVPELAVDRQFSGFAGADGLTSILMGNRGCDIVIRGTARGTGSSYSEARADAAEKIAAIANYQYATAEDYTFQGETFSQVVWNKIQTVPDNNGQTYHYTSGGEVIVNFISQGRCLTW